MEHKKRRQWSRLFGLVALGLLLALGLRFFQRGYPLSFHLRYLYHGVPQAEQLHQTRAEVFEGKKLRSRVLYYHRPTRASSRPLPFREQRIRLSKGSYHLIVTLTYANGKKRILRQSLPLLEGGGTFSIRLEEAR